MNTERKRPGSLYLLLISLLFQGLSGLAGGIGILMDPTGDSIGFPNEWLQGSPFHDYLIPGIILFTILGIVPLIIFYWIQIRHKLAWYGALFVGIALVIWIGVEILIIGYFSSPPLQLIYGLLGLIIIALCLPGSVRQFLVGHH